MAIEHWRTLGVLLVLIGMAGCTSASVVTDPPKPPNVSQCLLGPTPDLSAPPMFVWELPVYLMYVLGVLTEERMLRQGEHDCINEQKAEGIVR